MLLGRRPGPWPNPSDFPIPKVPVLWEFGRLGAAGWQYIGLA